MFGVGFSEVTTIQTAGRSHRMAATTSTPTSTGRTHRARPARRRARSAATIRPRGRVATGNDSIGSVLRVSPEQPELEGREPEDEGEQDPGHRRRRAEMEKVPEGRLVEMLDDGARGVTRPANSENENLTEHLER